MDESRIMAKYFDAYDKSRINPIINRAKKMLVPLIILRDKAINKLKKEGASEAKIQSVVRSIGVTYDNKYVRYRDISIDGCKHFEIGNYDKTWTFLMSHPDYWDKLLNKLLKLISIDNYVATMNWIGNSDVYQFENDELYVFFSEEDNMFMKLGFRPETGKLVIASIHPNESSEIDVDYYDSVDANDEAKEFYLKTLGKDIEEYTRTECDYTFKYISGNHIKNTKIEVKMGIYKDDQKLDEPSVWKNREEILDIADNFKYYYSTNTKFWVNFIECDDEGNITITLEFIRRDRYGNTLGDIEDKTCNYIKFPPRA